MTEKESGTSQPLTRREVLILGILGSAIAVSGTAFLYELSRYLKERNYTGEGNEDFPLAGELVRGGEIVNDQELADMYLEAVEEGRGIEPDATMIKSTIHNAMRFFGMDEEVAARRSHIISISTNQDHKCGRGDLACVYDSSSGLGLEITKKTFSRRKDQAQAWIGLSLVLSRSAYMMSVNKIDDSETREDYGVLGEYVATFDKRGFAARETNVGGVGDLIQRKVILDLQTGEKTQISVPEQFFADLGQIRYFKHLLSLGLDKSELAREYKDFAFYSFMKQGLINIQDTQGVGGAQSWQSWWGEALKFGRIDELNRESDRFELFYGMGEKIVERNNNRYSVELSAEDTAALGIIAFSDFVDYQLTNHRILASLEVKALSPASIVQDAVWLYFKMNEENQPPLPLEQAKVKPKPTPTV